MKILYVTTVSQTMIFFKSFIGELVNAGHTVESACNSSLPVDKVYNSLGCKVHNLPFSRSPFNKVNLTAYKQLKELIESGKYDIVHCHTPIAAACARIACRNARKSGTKVFYTAHGFHFYKGAPLKNWLIYYPVEKLCSYMTDVLITINREDYALAQKKMRAKKVEYVPGVGINIEKFTNFELSEQEKAEFRNELGIPEKAKLLVSVGELNENKNHQVILNAISLLEDKNIHYAIAGVGNKAECLTELAKTLGISERFHLLGYRNDIAKIYKAADICCFPSIREGLGMAALEGMAAGLPLVASVNRGTKDYCNNGINGFMCNPFSPQEFADAITKILSDSSLKEKMIQANTQKAKDFDIKPINKQMSDIYSEFN